jgi:hypothetical protein
MQLIPSDARYPDLHEEVVLLFREVEIELVHCPLCGDYHPPELHIQSLTPFDPSEPEEA